MNKLRRLKIFLLLLVLGLTGLYAKQIYRGTQYISKQIFSSQSGNKKESVNDSLLNATIKDGDIIFQVSEGGQGKAIQLATHSKYTHCGIIFKSGNDVLVYEAMQPVMRTPLSKWIARGKDGHYVIKRLKSDKVLTAETQKKMRLVGDGFIGKNYDLYFGWNDDKIYCSELVWKIYKRGAGIELGKLQQLKDYDLSNFIVKQKLKERYGDKIPYDEQVISPAGIFASDLLVTIDQK